MSTIDPNKLTTTQRAQLQRRAEQTGQSDQLTQVFQQRQAPRVTPASDWTRLEPELFWDIPNTPTPTPQASPTPPIQNNSIPEVNRPTDTTQASNQVIDTMTQSAAWDRADTEQFTQSLADIQKEREEINKAQQEREADFAKQKAESIKEMDAKFAEIEKQTQALIDQRLQRDAEDMKALKEAERTKLDAAWDLQRFRDEEALREARKGVMVSQMQANVAMNKLGLAFSTWAINMTQSIATNWFTAIAGLKIQANFNQANFQRDASQLEFDYSTEINRTIDKYTDQQIKLKEQTASRIFDTQNNLLLTERDKIDNINQLKEEYLNSKQATEEQIFKETQAARVRAETRAKNIQTEMLAEETRQRTEVARKIQNWSFHLLTASQKKQLADQANMSVEELSNIEDNFIQSQIYSMAEQIMGEDFLFTMEENIQISNTVKRLVDSGVGMEQAVDRAVADTIRKNPEYQRIQQIKREQEAAALRNAQLSWVPRVSSWGGWNISQSEMWQYEWNWASFSTLIKNKFWVSITAWEAKDLWSWLDRNPDMSPERWLSENWFQPQLELTPQTERFLSNIKDTIAWGQKVSPEAVRDAYNSMLESGWTARQAAQQLAAIWWGEIKVDWWDIKVWKTIVWTWLNEWTETFEKKPWFWSWVWRAADAIWWASLKLWDATVGRWLDAARTILTSPTVWEWIDNIRNNK